MGRGKEAPLRSCLSWTDCVNAREVWFSKHQLSDGLWLGARCPCQGAVPSAPAGHSLLLRLVWNTWTQAILPQPASEWLGLIHVGHHAQLAPWWKKLTKLCTGRKWRHLCASRFVQAWPTFCLSQVPGPRLCGLSPPALTNEQRAALQVLVFSCLSKPDGKLCVVRGTRDCSHLSPEGLWWPW